MARALRSAGMQASGPLTTIGTPVPEACEQGNRHPKETIVPGLNTYDVESRTVWSRHRIDCTVATDGHSPDGFTRLDSSTASERESNEH
jgi:hypothetical protein